MTGAGDKWVNEFVTGQQRIGAALDDEEAWVQEYVQSDFVNQSSFDNFFQEINVQVIGHYISRLFLLVGFRLCRKDFYLNLGMVVFLMIINSFWITVLDSNRY